MTDSAASSARAELSAYFSAFQADDTLITILPSFDSPDPLPLLSTAPVGPFKAGIPTAVPLWMAMLLHQRTLCSISPPAWLTASNLSEILAYEKKQEVLWTDTDRLPRNYYEIAKRLTGRRGIVFDDESGGSNSSQSHVLSLLVQDLLEVRVDKLRQQLPAVLAQHQEHSGKSVDDDGLEKEDSSAGELMMTITGIGSQELALLRPFIQQALNDRAFLLAGPENKKPSGNNSSNSNKKTTSSKEATESETAAEAPSRPRVTLRRFRR